VHNQGGRDKEQMMKRPSLSRAIPAAERRKILEEYESYPRGDVRRGALLRRHGIYSSQVAKWRIRRDQGDDTLGARNPGPVPQPVNPLAAEVARLTRENARLQTQLAQAEAILEIQKKVATLLGLTSPSTDGQR
jgi:transposase-like protein